MLGDRMIAASSEIKTLTRLLPACEEFVPLGLTLLRRQLQNPLLGFDQSVRG